MAPTKRQQSSNGVPPDGGYGWVVVFASFMLQALTIGITYTFGVMFVDLLEAFGAGESTTSWIGSIQPALLYFTGQFMCCRRCYHHHRQGYRRHTFINDCSRCRLSTILMMKARWLRVAETTTGKNKEEGRRRRGRGRGLRGVEYRIM